MKKLVFIFFILYSIAICSQTYKFGKVTKEELSEKSFAEYPSANAAILYAERKTNFEYSEEDGFYIKTEYYSRIKIYNQEGYDYATQKLYLYYNSASTKEEALFFKGMTYNLENGKIIKTKLAKNDIFEERLNRFYFVKKFTMPNLREGSVIEWKYTIVSPFKGRLDEIELQANIPIKKLKARVAIPEYYSYNILPKGYSHIPISNDKRQKTLTFGGFERTPVGSLGVTKSKMNASTVTYDEHISLIEMSNIPPLLDEAYSGDIDNYRLGLTYELSYVDYPGYSLKTFAESWETVVKNIYSSQYFGNQLDKTKHFAEDLPAVIDGKIAQSEKMTAIYQFVKSKIKWNGVMGYYSYDGTKKAYKEGLGNTADINLNLIAMLRSAGLDANPVLVSTISNGIPMYATKHGFNYVVAAVKLSENTLLLDATEKYAVPNVLPEKTLNFRGRIVYPDGKSKWIDLFSKSRSIKKTVVNAKFNELGFEGNARIQYSNRFALKFRLDAISDEKEALIDQIEEEIDEVEIIDARLSNLENLSKDVIETIKFESESFYEEIADKIYISPSLFLQIDENPFVSEERNFPIFYNTPWATVNTINMSIPESYSVESIPENAEYLLPNDIGLFQSMIVQKGQVLKITTSFVINEPVIDSANYQDLKEFYNLVIKKQAEKIVLVKN